ncbi:MAG: hypothetical protein WD875_05430 [Pirellulales bacterium]
MILANPAKTDAVEMYVRCLVELHRIMAAGKDDTPDAEVLRSTMDSAWYQLSENDIEVVGGLSEDLYSIGVDREDPPRESVPDSLAVSLSRYFACDEVAQLLLFIRKHERELPRVDAAVWRGYAWGRLGHPSASAEFFGESARVEPTNVLLRVSHIGMLIDCGKIDAAMPIARSLAEKADASSDELYTAGTVFFRAVLAQPPGEANEVLQEAVNVFQRAASAQRPPVPDVTNAIGLYAKAYSYALVGIWMGRSCIEYNGQLELGMCWEEMGDTDSARAAYREAESLGIDDDLAEILLHDLDTNHPLNCRERFRQCHPRLAPSTVWDFGLCARS